MAKKYVVGILVLIILTASVYVLFPNNVRIDVGETYSTFKVWENGSWVLAGKEYTLMFDGTRKMRASSRNVEQFVDGEIIKIIRTANFKNNVTVIDTYTFDGTVKDVELFPISHGINVLNGEGYILVYEVTKLKYFGETVKNIRYSPQSFGHKMKVEWEDGNYYSRIWKYANRDEGKLTVKYRPDSVNFTKQVRLFDPPKTTKENLMDKNYQNYLRTTDSVRVKIGNFYKSYNSSSRTILIENNKHETLVELKLLTDYRNHVGAGNGTKIAGIKLIESDETITPGTYIIHAISYFPESSLTQLILTDGLIFEKRL